MEMSLKIILPFVIFAYVIAVHQHHNVTETTMKPQNVTQQESREEKLRQDVADCTNVTKVNPDIVLKLMSQNWKSVSKKASVALKRWSLCVLVKSGMMSRDGVLRQDVVLAYVPQRDRDKVENVIDKCLYKKAHAPTETAWNYLICFRSKLPKYSLI